MLSKNRKIVLFHRDISNGKSDGIIIDRPFDRHRSTVSVQEAFDSMMDADDWQSPTLNGYSSEDILFTLCWYTNIDTHRITFNEMIKMLQMLIV